MGKKQRAKVNKLEKAIKKRQEEITYDLFDNPMTRAALNSMTPEQIETYKQIGEEMYGNIDFSNSKVVNNLPPPMAEALAYICEGLKSGLHPSDLEDNEIRLLEEGYGEEWYKKWGYTKTDLKTI